MHDRGHPNEKVRLGLPDRHPQSSRIVQNDDKKSRVYVIDSYFNRLRSGAVCVSTKIAFKLTKSAFNYVFIVSTNNFLNDTQFNISVNSKEKNFHAI